MNFTIDDLLKEAQQIKASDLHVTVGIPPKGRVNGELVNLNYPLLSPEDTEELIKPIIPKMMMDVFLTKGEVDFSYSIAELGRYRVNVFRQRGSYAAVFRIINSIIPSPDKLGLPNAVKELTKKRRGLVLVTGPTGSGKSTTLASLIDIINTNYNYHVITLEDPIEYLHKHKKSIVNQREIGIDSLSFANALRVVLREDPDVILVGEMRDLETIEIAITAAETGHLVFSTLHTTGAVSTIDRIIDVFPPHQQQQIKLQLSSVLEGVISQQLIPTIDKTSRVAAFEVMLTTPAIRNLIREGKNHQIASFIQTSKKQGMQTMDDAIFELYTTGRIDKGQAVSFAQDMATMERRVN
ncbi:MAG: type IV pilus twitching motility protein PilT [Clostridiales bacterium]|mgnify:CR=1 FL=1|nr:type IV pilus twitching motility protein PilT [Clostridiales bacterium]